MSVVVFIEGLKVEVTKQPLGTTPIISTNDGKIG
jgi:hypothetical protein